MRSARGPSLYAEGTVGDSAVNCPGGQSLLLLRPGELSVVLVILSGRRAVY
jgi:hypothetical protein